MNKNFMSGLEHYIHSNPKFNSRIPTYNDDSDYTTNAPSYYDDLARKNKLMKVLALRIWEYEEEMIRRLEQWDKNLEDFPEDVKKLLEKWLEDGTLDHIINDTIFSWKLDTEIYDALRIDIYDKDHGTTKKRIDYREHRIKDIMLNVKDYGVKGDQSVNDDSAINNMINTVPERSTVYFPDGEYLINKVLINKPLKIIMSDNAKFISYSNPEVKKETGLIEINHSDVELYNINIDGNNHLTRGIKVNNTTEYINNIKLKNINVYNILMSAIWVNKVNNMYIDHVNIHDIDLNSDGLYGAVRIEECNKGTINNIFLESVQGKGLALKLCNHMTVDNLIANNTGQLQPGYYLNDSHYIYSTNIICLNGDENAVKFSRGATHCYINGGYFEGITTTRPQGGYALILQGASYCEVENVVINSVKNINSIRIEDHPNPEGANSIGNIIKKCHVYYEGTGDSISVRTRPETEFNDQDNILQGLVIDGGNHGITMSDTKNLKIMDCAFKNLNNRAVQINNSEHVKVINNIINDINTIGITVFNSSYYTIEDNIINGNNIGVTGISCLDPNDYGKILNNTINDFTTSGISMFNTINCLVMGNIISNGGEGFTLNNTLNVTIKENTVSDFNDFTFRLNNNNELKVIDNTVINQGGTGVSSFNTKDFTFTGNTFKGNSESTYGFLAGATNERLLFINNIIKGFNNNQVRSVTGLIDGTFTGNILSGGTDSIYMDENNQKIRVFGNSFESHYISEGITEIYNEGNF